MNNNHEYTLGFVSKRGMLAPFHSKLNGEHSDKARDEIGVYLWENPLSSIQKGILHPTCVIVKSQFALARKWGLGQSSTAAQGGKWDPKSGDNFHQFSTLHIGQNLQQYHI